jgi:2'-5' RNA ligase
MFAVFIEPDYRLKKFIKVLKKKIYTNYNNSFFLNHPPHSTIFYSDLKNNKLALSNILKIFKRKLNIKIICKVYSLFTDTPIKGQSTLFIKIKKNKELSKLQLDLANNLSNYVKKEYLIKNKNKFKQKYLKSSFLKYGFPYVGRHWIPHFTIGSIRNKDQGLKKNFLKNNKIFIFKVKHITFWNVHDDRHILIGKKKLY